MRNQQEVWNFNQVRQNTLNGLSVATAGGVAVPVKQQLCQDQQGVETTPVPAVLENHQNVSVLASLVNDEKSEVVKEIDVDDVWNDDMYTKDVVDDNEITKAASPIKKELSLVQA